MITAIRKTPEYIYVIATIIGAFLLTRIYNLNYNSPFNDEAIYVVIGRLGLFQWDWTSYSTSSWMAGIPFFYPPLAALAYTTGGIVGARLLNVVFGVLTLESIFMIAYLITNDTPVRKIAAGIISVALLGGSAVSYYVSRIATYDIPSYYFLFLTISLLLYLQQHAVNKSKWYFISFLTLFASFGMKITTGYFFIPPLVIISFYLAKKGNKRQLKQWRSYFLIPLALSLLLYGIFNLNNFLTFLSTQVAAREKAVAIDVVNVFLNNSNYIWFYAIVGSIGFVVKKEFNKLMILILGSLWILAAHLFTSRVPTLDKHTFISVAFLTILSGVGIVYFGTVLVKSKILKSFLLGSLIGLISVYWYVSYLKSLDYNRLWTNTDAVLSHLQTKVQIDDNVITELGSTTLLYTYDQIHPNNVTTFDWFEYHGKSGKEAYLAGMQDGYFDLVVLESQQRPKSDNNRNMHQLVIDNLGDIYYKTYDKDGFYIYEKKY